MTEKKYIPSIIRDTEWTEAGLAETEHGLLVPAYVASEWGFHTQGQKDLNMVIYPKLTQLGVMALCPFAACNEYLDLDSLENMQTRYQEASFWECFNNLIGEVNYKELMPRSKMLIALLDGGHAIDDGVASEIGYYAAKGYGPIIGIRSDIRLSENPSAPVNPAVRYFLDHNGFFFRGAEAYDTAYAKIRELADCIKYSKFS